MIDNLKTQLAVLDIKKQKAAAHQAQQNQNDTCSKLVKAPIFRAIVLVVTVVVLFLLLGGGSSVWTALVSTLGMMELTQVLEGCDCVIYPNLSFLVLFCQVFEGYLFALHPSV